MIKIDYESAWKEFRIKHGDYPMGEDIDIATQMNNIEEKHTRDFIELKKRTPERKECYWKELYTDTIIELAELQKKLKDVKKAIE
jgi:hypothetical protein